jgi:hypothetical protein
MAAWNFFYALFSLGPWAIVLFLPQIIVLALLWHWVKDVRIPPR